jgi:serine/threonine-protein kinase RsbT
MTREAFVERRGILVSLATDADVLLACQRVRMIAEQAGFSPMSSALVGTVVAEVISEFTKFAASGTVFIRDVEAGLRRGIHVTVAGGGPGTSGEDGRAASDGLVLGLTECRVLLDECEIISILGRGTRVSMIKWLPQEEEGATGQENRSDGGGSARTWRS